MRTTAWLLGITLALAGSAQAAPRDRAAAARPLLDETFSAGSTDPVSHEPWWTTVEDPVLAALIDEGLSGNGDLQAAWDRAVQADARAASSLAGVLPSASLDAGVNLAPYDSLGFSFGGFPEMEWPEFPDIPGIEWPEFEEDATEDPDVYWTGQVMASVRVPLDLWGTAIPTHQAGRFDAQAAEGDAAAQALSLATRIAGAYYDVVAARQQLAIVQRQLQTNEALLEITELRFEQSEATALDVLQQRQQVAATQSLLPQARQVATTREQQLAVLLGRNPTDDLGLALTELPGPGPLPATGSPLDLTDNRPDLRAAADRLDAAWHRKDGAIRSFLPSLALTGQAGMQWNHLTEYDSQNTWGAGVSLSLPLFEGTRRWQGLREARAGEDEAVHLYRQLLLGAVQQVEGALVAETGQRAQLTALRAQRGAATTAFEESRARYAAGLTSYLTVLLALTTQQQAELSVLQAERAVLDTRIQLHESLGGRWTETLSGS
jgi:outer membrane protein, multidrug efflux system